MNERELILKTRRGDKEAFGELVKLCQQRLFLTIYRLIGNYDDALELTQDAFIVAYQAVKGFRLRSSFYTWLYRIAINLAYHKLRSREYKFRLKNQPLLDPLNISSWPNPRQSLFAKEQRETISQGLASLPAKFYQVIVLHDLEGLCYKEIAEIQHCSLGTVMSRLHRARLQLAQKLKVLGIKTP